MPDPLTIGKIRGLSATSTREGVFTILAFDHRQSFVRMVPADRAEVASFEQVVAAKSAVVRALAAHASGVLLDPLYSAAQTIANRALPGQTGLLVAVEETGYTGGAAARANVLAADWSVAQIKRMGADAVKLLLYYHPEAGTLTERQEALAADVIAACRQADIAFFLEAVSYSIDPAVDRSSAAFAAARPALIREIAGRLGGLGPEVLKLEFPVDPYYDLDEASWTKACQAVSQASPCPWALLSAGVEFELFARQVEIACRSGASGYIAGRAIWKEGIALPAGERDAWLRDVAARRLEALAEIAVKYARPWTDFHPDLEGAAPEGWYAAYEE
jgi:tagatose 1,6-diphosphate aldolase